jgi:hypothetical protein
MRKKLLRLQRLVIVCKILQAVARNIWPLPTTWDINFKVEHITGKDNVVADLLSTLASLRQPSGQIVYSIE